MLIVADENIPFVQEAFQALGEVRLIHGRRMTPAAVRGAGLVLVRSITRVDRALLEGSAVRFVGTATIGADHVDTDYLREAGVAFAAAPGSNANSVAEYVTAALLTLARRQDRPLEGRTVGIIGAGNVGSRVAVKAQALRMRVALNDPPLQRATGDPKYRPLAELMDCDFLTLHVPLEKAGPDRTYRMADAGFLARMRRDAVLLNTSRGAVADNEALRDALKGGRLGAAVLDVWEGEPRIRTELLESVALGTPHIAGYSLDGKVNGTAMIYRAACAFLGRKPEWSPEGCMPPPEFPEILLQPRPGEPALSAAREAVLRVYPIERDDAALRKLSVLPPAERGPFFDRLRKEYPVRREFQNTTVRLGTDGHFDVAPALRSSAASAVADTLRGIGFNVA